MSAPPVSPPLILASRSPRRRELLTRAGIPFDAFAAEVDERRVTGEAPLVLARRLARSKASVVARPLPALPRRLVLGADTIVVLEEEALGKPRDAQEALDLLSRLVGHTHQVLTGVALVDTLDQSVASTVVSSRVVMRRASSEELRAYVASGEPLDKAGAYAAQGEGRRFIDGIDGSESNVIGLPLEETLDLLRTAGFPMASGASSQTGGT